MISSRTKEDVTSLMRHESTDILYCCWVMPIAQVTICWRVVLESGAENRGDFRSQELTSVLCCAFWAQVTMEKTYNIWIHMADLVVMIFPSVHHSQSSNTMIDHYLAWTLVAAKRETQAAILTHSTHWFCRRTKVWHNRIIFSKHQWTMSLTALDCYLHRSYLPVREALKKEMFFF